MIHSIQAQPFTKTVEDRSVHGVMATVILDTQVITIPVVWTTRDLPEEWCTLTQALIGNFVDSISDAAEQFEKRGAYSE